MVAFNDIRRGMRVRADIGRDMIDARAGDVIDIDKEDETVTVSLGNDEMAGPYIVSASRVTDILQ
jgi:hypothetical protein